MIVVVAGATVNLIMGVYYRCHYALPVRSYRYHSDSLVL